MTAEKAPRVSVIVAVYDTERYLGECLESVLAQSMSDLEVICIDDGSTDGSPSVLETFAGRDSRVKVARKDNGGQSSARNAGIDMARGEYVLFLDSDDYLDLDALEILCEKADADRLDDLFYTAQSFFESPEEEAAAGQYADYYARTAQYPDVMTGCALFSAMSANFDVKPHPGLQLLRRSLLTEGGVRFFEGIVYEDNLFTMQCYALAKRAAYLDEALYHRRVRGGSTMTSARDFKYAYGYYKCVHEMIRFADERGLKANAAYYRSLAAYLDVLIGNAARDLEGISDDELWGNVLALDDEERMEFLLLVGGRRSLMERSRERLHELQGEVALFKKTPALANLVTARIDLVRTGAGECTLEVLSTSDEALVVREPAWMAGPGERGWELWSGAGSLKLRIACRGAGGLEISARAMKAQVAVGGEAAKPVSLRFTRALVDSEELFETPAVVGYGNAPVRHMEVTDGQVVTIELAWEPRANADFARVRSRLDAAFKEISGLKAELRECEAELKRYDGILESRTWRAGRAVTWLPRKLRGIFGGE